MDTIHDRLKSDLTLANKRPNTIAAYGQYARLLERFAARPLDTLEEADVRRYRLDLVARGRSASSRAVPLAAVRFLYSVTLQRPEVTMSIPRPVVRRIRRIPLTPSEVQALLDAADGPLARAAIQTAYATGLRVSELRRLQVGDIDAKAGLVRVREGKGGYPRVVMLCPVLLALLRAYWREVRPPGPWLFPGRKPGSGTHAAHPWTVLPIGKRLLGELIQVATERAGLRRTVGFHDLRHAFASHLLLQGTDIRLIQVRLGHANIRTTEVYVHIGDGQLRAVQSPLDAVLGSHKTS